MQKKTKLLPALLIGCLLFAFAAPVQAESVTNQVYSEIEIVNLAVKVVPDDKQLTVTFPKNFSEDVEAATFELAIQKTTEATLSAPVKLDASSVKSATGSYAFKNLTNKTSYKVQVTAYSEDGDVIAQGTGTGTPAAKLAITGVTAKVGDGSISLTFNKLSGATPTSYQIQYWYKKDAKGNPIFEKPITIKASSVTKATYTSVFLKLKNGSVYHFNVTAEKNGETIALTSNVTATPKAPAKKK